MNDKQHHFDPITRLYVYSSDRMIDPKNSDQFLPVLCATPDSLPTLDEHETIRRLADDSAWEIVDDYRGFTYWLADGSEHLISDISIAPPGAALFEAPPLPAVERRTTAKIAIDTAAGVARARYVSSGQLVEEEYRLAQQQTQAWRTAGSPAGAVPLGIQGWADASGMTAEQAATSIEQTAAGWETVLLAIRQIRLAGKASVDASGDTADFDAVAQVYITQLEGMQP